MWPFFDDASGAKIQKDKFYGFSDAGGLAGSFSGYDTRREAIADIMDKYDIHFIEADSYFGATPEDLGDNAVTVLSGEEYVNRLKFICGDLQPLSFYGYWVGA